MGRAPRRIGADLVYHVTIRGNRRAAVFLDDQDRRKFLTLLESIAQDRSWEGWAWCLMDNHVHLCLTTVKPNLSDGMRDLFGRYARFFNWKYGLDAHLFGSRFHAVDVADDAQLITVIRYIAHNPVRAGLVADPREWTWSSLRGVLDPTRTGGFIDPDRVLGLFHPRPVHATALLRQLVALPSPEDAGLAPASAPGAAAIAQVLVPRHAAAELLRRGTRLADAARLVGASRGAVQGWQRSGFHPDRRRSS